MNTVIKTVLQGPFRYDYDEPTQIMSITSADVDDHLFGTCEVPPETWEAFVWFKDKRDENAQEAAEREPAKLDAKVRTRVVEAREWLASALGRHRMTRCDDSPGTELAMAGALDRVDRVLHGEGYIAAREEAAEGGVFQFEPPPAEALPMDVRGGE